MEKPQRPLKIWGFDVSKQVLGSALVHVANIVMSMLSSGQLRVNTAGSTTTDIVTEVVAEGKPYQPNPCSFYLLNLAIDVRWLL